MRDRGGVGLSPEGTAEPSDFSRPFVLPFLRPDLRTDRRTDLAIRLDDFCLKTTRSKSMVLLVDCTLRTHFLFLVLVSILPVRFRPAFP